MVYEAEPTGDVLYRWLQQLKIARIVVAPTKTSLAKGVRQKIGKRDAITLAQLHRAGKLYGIHVPDAVDESIHDMTRARADTVHDLTGAKQSLNPALPRSATRRAARVEVCGYSRQQTTARTPWLQVHAWSWVVNRTLSRKGVKETKGRFGPDFVTFGSFARQWLKRFGTRRSHAGLQDALDRGG